MLQICADLITTCVINLFGRGAMRFANTVAVQFAFYGFPAKFDS